MVKFNGISIPCAYYNGHKLTHLKIVSSQGTGSGEIETSTLRALSQYTLSQLNEKKLSEV